MSFARPSLDALQSPRSVLDTLTSLYDEIVRIGGNLLPSRAPALKAITLPTHAAARSSKGDVNGEGGPRCCIIAGRLTPVDGGQGTYAWDPSSTLADDDANVLQVTGLSVGRWRKI